MSYPDYPNNRLIVNDVDITQRFGIVLVDGYTLAPPEPKTYAVDIPGGNGKLDLTKTLLGDTAYGNRKQEFIFRSIYPENFEKVKTDVSNFLHGQDFDYQMTMDPDYTYHGRFSVSSYSHSPYSKGVVGELKITIDANPFKYKEVQIYKIDAIGGIIVTLESGRKRVRPIIESNGFLKIIFDGKLITLPTGTWSLNDVQFEYGGNELYLNSYEVHNLTWGDLVTNSTTWSQFKEKKLYEWYKSNGDQNILMQTWADVADRTWNDLSILTWADLIKIVGIDTTVPKVRIQYDWGDL